MDGFEVDHEFPGIGRRTLLLTRAGVRGGRREATLLLAFEDVIERRAAERERVRLLERRRSCCAEGRLAERAAAPGRQQPTDHRQHPELKARSVTSEETRLHLHDAHRRVMSVAAVQEHLQASGRGDLIEIGPYLSKLCATLAASMIGDTRPVSLRVQAEDGTAASGQAVSLGLIVTELVINALKHAFPDDKPDGRVLVSYETDGADWRLVVSDNGAGKPDGTVVPAHIGLAHRSSLRWRSSWERMSTSPAARKA
jgi:chemotaxis protein methyltransferase CheR